MREFQLKIGLFSILHKYGTGLIPWSLPFSQTLSFTSWTTNEHYSHNIPITCSSDSPLTGLFTHWTSFNKKTISPQLSFFCKNTWHSNYNVKVDVYFLLNTTFFDILKEKFWFGNFFEILVNSLNVTWKIFHK